MACTAPASSPAPTAAPAKAAPTAAAKPAPTAAAAASPPAKAPAVAKVEPITVRLGWLYSGYYMPYFYGVDRGFFREQGLEPTINQGQGSVPVMQLVANGQDLFGNLDVSVAAIGLQNNLPIKMVATYFQINPQALVVFDDSGIKSLKDLEGKSIGVIPGANTTLFIPQLLKQNGVDPEKVNLVNTDPANLIPAFLSKKVDVSTALVNDQPIVFEAQGQKVRSFLFADHGINALSVGIGVHTNTIRDRGDLIRRFLTATNQGWDAAMKDPDAGVDAMMKLVPNLNKNILLGQFKATVPLLHTERSKGKPLGWTAKEDLDATVTALVQVGALKAPVSVDSLYTNEYLP